jgi:hypothetical protein
LDHPPPVISGAFTVSITKNQDSPTIQNVSLDEQGSFVR